MKTFKYANVHLGGEEGETKRNYKRRRKVAKCCDEDYF